jgi:hypothetical protein
MKIFVLVAAIIYGGLFMGDYTGNAWNGNSFYVMWPDTRNGINSQEYIGGEMLKSDWQTGGLRTRQDESANWLLVSIRRLPRGWVTPFSGKVRSTIRFGDAGILSGLTAGSFERTPRANEKPAARKPPAAPVRPAETHSTFDRKTPALKVTELTSPDRTACCDKSDGGAGSETFRARLSALTDTGCRLYAVTHRYQISPLSGRV